MIEFQDTPTIEEFFAKAKDTLPKDTLVKDTDNTRDPRVVIADIHGDYNAFLESLQYGLEYFKDQDPEVILLGDLFDRGLDSGEVLDAVIKLINSNIKIKVLTGNHESMMLKAIFEPNFHNICSWFDNGGLQTLVSFVGLVDSCLNKTDWDQMLLYSREFDSNQFANFFRSSGFKLQNFLSDLSKTPKIVQLVDNLDLCLQRGQDIYVHGGLMPSFIMSYSDINDWLVSLNESFRVSLDNFIHHKPIVADQTTFDDFLAASYYRGGDSVAGPLWTDKRDFQNFSTFDKKLLVGLFNHIGANRMVVGHSVVASPEYLILSSVFDLDFGVLFLDCGISRAYSGVMNAQCLCVDTQGQSFVLDDNYNFTKL